MKALKEIIDCCSDDWAKVIIGLAYLGALMWLVFLVFTL